MIDHHCLVSIHYCSCSCIQESGWYMYVHILHCQWHTHCNLWCITPKQNVLKYSHHQNCSIPIHLTPASWEWSQLCTPWGVRVSQSSSLDSLPLHANSSRKMGPTPSPKYAPLKTSVPETDIIGQDNFGLRKSWLLVYYGHESSLF